MCSTRAFDSLNFSVRIALLLCGFSLLAWLAFLACRTPYTDQECRSVGELVRQEAARLPSGSLSSTSDQPHLWGGRPIYSGWFEPPAVKALILPNFMALLIAEQIAAPHARRLTCKQSWTLAFWTLVFTSLQWLVLGYLAGQALTFLSLPFRKRR